MGVLTIFSAILLIFGISFTQEYIIQKQERNQLKVLIRIGNKQIRDTALILFLEQHPRIAKQIGWNKQN